MANWNVQGNQWDAWIKGRGLEELAGGSAGRNGSTYEGLIDKGFDPWTNLGQNNGGQYQGRSQSRWDNGTRKENDMERVWRLTNDQLKANGFADAQQADPRLRARVFAAQVERLRQDYTNNGLDWSQSDFAHLGEGIGAGDNFSYNGKLYNRAGKEIGPTPDGAKVGTTLPVPPMGQAPGNQAPGVTPPAAAAPPARVPPKYNPATGKMEGGSGGDSSQLQRDMWLSNPAQALREAFNRQGIDINQPGVVGEFVNSRYVPMLEARIAAQAADGTGSDYANSIESIMNEYGQGLTQRGGGNNFYGQQEAYADKALGAGDFLSQLDTKNAQAYIEQQLALKTGGYNPMVRSAMTNVYDREKSNYMRDSFNNPQDAQDFYNYFKQRPSFSFFGRR